jgi:hypothetical protein
MISRTFPFIKTALLILYLLVICEFDSQECIELAFATFITTFLALRVDIFLLNEFVAYSYVFNMLNVSLYTNIQYLEDAELFLKSFAMGKLILDGFREFSMRVEEYWKKSRGVRNVVVQCSIAVCYLCYCCGMVFVFVLIF